MSKKKRKRAPEPQSPIERLIRRYPKWPRRIGITAALVGVVAAIWFFADPFGPGPTAIDESGLEVKVGVIDGDPDAEARTNFPAPNFLLADYDGQAVRLDDYEGKAVFVNFWASWCGPCAEEMPEIVRIAKNFTDDVVVIAINCGASKGTAQRWTRALNLPEDLPNFKWVLDTRESVVREYRVEGMPQSFFIDGSGIIRSAVRSGIRYDDMLTSIEQALNFTVPSAVSP